MFATSDGEEIVRQICQVLETASSTQEMLHDIKKLAGLWASARLRFKDIESHELCAAWGKIVTRSVDSAITSHEAWKKKLLRDSAPTGDIVQVEEQLTKLKEVSQFKWTTIEPEL